MKIIILTLGLLAATASQATNMQWKALSKKILSQHTEECKNLKINVSEIVKNSHIQGAVTGFKETSLDDFKVLFYVRTENWYVHPYEYNPAQPSGYSYSDFAAGGTFWIRSVFRTPAKEMAVIVVPSPHFIYNKSSGLKGLLKYACNYVVVPGNGDFAP